MVQKTMQESKTKLTAKKRKFIEYLKNKDLNNTHLSQIKAEIGISTATYYRWISDGEFMKIVNEESITEFKEGYRHVLQVIKDKALQGDMKAVRLYLNIFNTVKTKSLEDLTPDELITLVKTAKREIENEKKKVDNNQEVDIYALEQGNETEKKIGENIR